MGNDNRVRRFDNALRAEAVALLVDKKLSVSRAAEHVGPNCSTPATFTVNETGRRSKLGEDRFGWSQLYLRIFNPFHNHSPESILCHVIASLLS